MGLSRALFALMRSIVVSAPLVVDGRRWFAQRPDSDGTLDRVRYADCPAVALKMLESVVGRRPPLGRLAARSPRQCRSCSSPLKTNRLLADEVPDEGRGDGDELRGEQRQHLGERPEHGVRDAETSRLTSTNRRNCVAGAWWKRVPPKVQSRLSR